MGKRIEYSKDAAKTLSRIDRTTSRRIRRKVEQLADDPASLANNVSVLKGGEGLMRLRIGNWRVIYTETLLILQVEKVGPRGSAYD